MSSVPIVIIDDNAGSLELLSTALARDGVVVHTAQHPFAGLSLVREYKPRLVLTDLVMPDMSGLDVLSHVMQIDPTTDVVLMTAHYTTETAVAAIQNGAADYLEKPVRIAVLRERIYRLLKTSKLREQAVGSSRSEEANFEGIVAKSDVMWKVFGIMQRIAPHYRSVLLHGATGVGKDLLAAALHRLSDVPGNFVVINCSAVVETLFESELFGHVRGAFTGADKDKAGLFEHADGGTLFLDEVGDMPMATQAKLLRAVQNQEIQRIGSLTARRVNVRIIAATHRDLHAAIREGRFREDLFYRLSMVEIEVPPLRDRIEDIPLLAGHFIAHFAALYRKPLHGLSPRVRSILEEYTWPGNVRELENVLGHACMMAAGEQIEPGDLPIRILPANTASTHPSPIAPHEAATPNQMTESVKEPLPFLAAQEREMIALALASCAGNQSDAARKLGIGRDALRYKMKKYGLA